MVTSVKCSKCGLVQMARPTCKACGAGLGGGVANLRPRSRPAIPGMAAAGKKDALGKYGGPVGILAAVIAALIGRYSGLHLLIPLGGVLLAGLVAAKTLPSRVQPLLPAVAVQGGHLVWILVGATLLGQVGLVLLPVILMMAGITWVIAKPGVASIGCLTAFQVIFAGLNLWDFAEASVGSVTHKALL